MQTGSQCRGYPPPHTKCHHEDNLGSPVKDMPSGSCETAGKILVLDLLMACVNHGKQALDNTSLNLDSVLPKYSSHLPR